MTAAAADLAAFYQERSRDRLGEPVPPMVMAYVRKTCDQLVNQGNSPRVIRKAIELTVFRKEHPKLLSFRVLDAAQGRAACVWSKHPNKLRLTPSQLFECGCTDCRETVPFSEVA